MKIRTQIFVMILILSILPLSLVSAMLITVYCVSLLTGSTKPYYDSMIEMADNAMYQVKNSTKNGYCILPDDNE